MLTWGVSLNEHLVVMAIKSGVSEWKLMLAVSTMDSEMFFGSISFLPSKTTVLFV